MFREQHGECQGQRGDHSAHSSSAAGESDQATSGHIFMDNLSADICPNYTSYKSYKPYRILYSTGFLGDRTLQFFVASVADAS